MTWKALKTETDRERVIKKYVENNLRDFNKYVSHTFIAVIFINANAEVDHQYILIDEYQSLKRHLFAFKVPFMVIYKERPKNKIESKPLIFGDRKLVYEKNENFF